MIVDKDKIVFGSCTLGAVINDAILLKRGGFDGDYGKVDISGAEQAEAYAILVRYVASQLGKQPLDNILRLGTPSR